MLEIAICEDENNAALDLCHKLTAYFSSKDTEARISLFKSGEELEKDSSCFDILFMDIGLTGMDGMKAVKRLREEGNTCQVIFITAYREYVFQAFDVDAVHYLVKPVRDEELFFAVDKARKRLTADNRTIMAACGGQVQILTVRDILYCESMNHKLIIHTVSDNISYFGTLHEMLMQLDSSFFRCHKSFIVNMRHVVKLEKEQAVMINGDKILISRRKRQEFAQSLLKFFRDGGL